MHPLPFDDQSLIDQSLIGQATSDLSTADQPTIDQATPAQSHVDHDQYFSDFQSRLHQHKQQRKRVMLELELEHEALLREESRFFAQLAAARDHPKLEDDKLWEKLAPSEAEVTQLEEENEGSKAREAERKKQFKVLHDLIIGLQKLLDQIEPEGSPEL